MIGPNKAAALADLMGTLTLAAFITAALVAGVWLWRRLA